MKTSYHNHTLHSDGDASIEEMAQAAAQAGLGELGISDHLALHPEGVLLGWSMAEGQLGAYVDDVLAAMGGPGPRAGPERREDCASGERLARGPSILLGLEADFFPETVEKLRSLLAPYPFDYIIGSVHFADSFQVDAGRKPWEALTLEERKAKWEVYWRRVAEMAQSRAFDFVGHLDLPKRFAPNPDEGVSPAADSALNAIAQAGMAMEINTSGWFHPARDPYPSAIFLSEARKRGIPILINADAHKAKHVARGFDEAVKLAREAGYSEAVRYEKRRRFPAPL
ncbi:MAG: histidinol-phosphatase [Elusimicrobia bacterium]|nr:histidinol-phosphatase [Elusimicrobiota bacterium]